MKRLLRLLLLGFVVLILTVTVIWPTLDAFLIRRQIQSALLGASTIRLQEYAGLAVLTTIDLPRSEWHRVTGAVPVVPDTGIPVIMKMCFWPHHRVVITDDHGSEFVFRVCFHCDEVATDSAGIRSTPFLWRSSLRRLFIEQKIPIRDDHEYSKLQKLAYQSDGANGALGAHRSSS